MKRSSRTREELRRLLSAARRDPRREALGLYAARGSLYLFLSLGPLTALLLSLLPYTPVTREQLLAALEPAPAGFRRLMQSVAADVYAGGSAALGVSAALELWSGGRFLAAVVRGLSALCGTRRGYFRARLLGAGLTAALALLLLGDLTLLLFGGRLLLTAALRWPRLAGLWRLLMGLRPLLMLCGLTAINALLFRYGASAAGSLARQLPGAALAAGGWLAFSRLWSWALERFRLFGVYGSIAAAAASLYWMYGSLYILFFGAWLGALPGGRGGEQGSGM